MRGTDRSVLVVEGDKRLSQRWRVAIGPAQVGSSVVHTLREAKARLTLKAWVSQPFELVVLDQQLPDGSGSSLLPELRQLTPAPLVAVMDAANDQRLALELSSMGTLHVPKPTDPDVMRQLLESIEERAGGGRALSIYCRLNGVSARESEALRHWMRGLSRREIAGRMECSEGTVKSYLQRICYKTHASSKKELFCKLFVFAANHGNVE